jgi:hypothetical protein
MSWPRFFLLAKRPWEAAKNGRVRSKLRNAVINETREIKLSQQKIEASAALEAVGFPSVIGSLLLRRKIVKAVTLVML